MISQLNLSTWINLIVIFHHCNRVNNTNTSCRGKIPLWWLHRFVSHKRQTFSHFEQTVYDCETPRILLKVQHFIFPWGLRTEHRSKQLNVVQRVFNWLWNSLRLTLIPPYDLHKQTRPSVRRLAVYSWFCTPGLIYGMQSKRAYVYIFLAILQWVVHYQLKGSSSVSSPSYYIY